jgi:hypothetical protein
LSLTRHGGGKAWSSRPSRRTHLWGRAWRSPSEKPIAPTPLSPERNEVFLPAADRAAVAEIVTLARQLFPEGLQFGLIDLDQADCSGKLAEFSPHWCLAWSVFQVSRLHMAYASLKRHIQDSLMDQALKE